jgi:hypothetical protein
LSHDISIWQVPNRDRVVAISKKIDVWTSIYFWLGNLILKSQFHIVTVGAEHTSVTLINKKSLFFFNWLGLPNAEFAPNALLDAIKS